MRAGYVSKCVDHRENDQSECQCDADVRDGAATGFVDHDGAGAGEDERKRADKLRAEFLHIFSRVEKRSLFESDPTSDDQKHRHDK